MGAVESPHQVQVEFKLTRNEAMAVYRWQLRKLLFRPWTAIGTSCMALGGIIALSSGVIVLGLVFLGGAVFQIFCFAWLLTFAPSRAWRSQEQPGPTTIVFTDDEVNVKTTNTSAQHQWAFYSATIEREALYLLKVGTRAAYQPVPVRSFAHPGDEDFFRLLATRHTIATLK